jgi:hypothetical protein
VGAARKPPNLTDRADALLQAGAVGVRFRDRRLSLVPGFGRLEQRGLDPATSAPSARGKRQALAARSNARASSWLAGGCVCPASRADTQAVSASARRRIARSGRRSPDGVGDPDDG